MASECPYTVRKATRSDVPAIKTLVDQEQWDDYILDFLYCMHNLYPEAWFVAETDSGEIVGVQALVKYSDHLAAGGIYIVKKELRGCGIGRAVNAAALGVVGKGNMVLSATDVNLYNTRGFTYDYDVYLKRGPPEILLQALTKQEDVYQDVGLFLTEYEDSAFSDLETYDVGVCKHKRTEFLRSWILETSKDVLVCRNSMNEMVGYGCLRKIDCGYQLAPVYANSVRLAVRLMKELLMKVNSKGTVDMFVVSPNKAMIEILEKTAFESKVTVHKMYKTPMNADLDKVYSLSSLEMSIV